MASEASCSEEAIGKAMRAAVSHPYTHSILKGLFAVSTLFCGATLLYQSIEEHDRPKEAPVQDAPKLVGNRHAAPELSLSQRDHIQRLGEPDLNLVYLSTRPRLLHTLCILGQFKRLFVMHERKCAVAFLQQTHDPAASQAVHQAFRTILTCCEALTHVCYRVNELEIGEKEPHELPYVTPSVELLSALQHSREALVEAFETMEATWRTFEQPELEARAIQKQRAPSNPSESSFESGNESAWDLADDDEEARSLLRRTERQEAISEWTPQHEKKLREMLVHAGYEISDNISVRDKRWHLRKMTKHQLGFERVGTLKREILLAYDRDSARLQRWCIPGNDVHEVLSSLPVRGAPKRL